MLWGGRAGQEYALGCGPGLRHVDVSVGRPEGGVRAQGTGYVQSSLPVRPACLMTTRIYHQFSSGVGGPLSQSLPPSRSRLVFTARSVRNHAGPRISSRSGVM